MRFLLAMLVALMIGLAVCETARAGGVAVKELTGTGESQPATPESRYQSWLGYSPIPAVLIILAGGAWLWMVARRQQAAQPAAAELAATLTLNNMSTDEANAARESVPEHENAAP